MSRIRDGNDIKPPRNLIDLVTKALEEQVRRSTRDETEFMPGKALISPDALKRGLARLSNERVEDTLLAEAGDYAQWIERFRNGKAEHNSESIAVTSSRRLGRNSPRSRACVPGRSPMRRAARCCSIWAQVGRSQKRTVQARER